MELLQLKYFQELARSQHLSKTAEKLHIAQPSLSQTLHRLEAELGTTLFDRVGKRIVLNNHGRIFLKYVDQIFTALDNASLELNTARQTEEKTVALHIYSASMLLPALIQRIQNMGPDIRLQIFQQPLEQDSSDPALFLTSSHLCPDEPNTIPLLKEPLVISLPREHPLAQKPALYIRDLREQAFLSLNQTSNLASTLRHYYEQYHFEPHITTLADNPAMIRDLLRLHLGAAFIPAYTWQGFASDTVVLRSVTDMPMHRYILLSWKPDHFQTPAMKLCRDIILQYFTEYSLQFLSPPAD